MAGLPAPSWEQLPCHHNRKKTVGRGLCWKVLDLQESPGWRPRFEFHGFLKSDVECRNGPLCLASG
jgi:hypothetical protein